MKYLLMAYRDRPQREAGSASEAAAFDQACRANDQALHASGYLLAAVSLQARDGATTVRVQAGELTINDSPAGQAHEQLAALYIIDARDLNTALRIAAQMPQARRGSIQIRSIEEGGLL
jgi:hypothetical protein